ncbi:MAG TPA: SDR family oxidoreductase [Polyangiaceae bacterium]|jgi:NAD(P)-dependent dehydrogenase (short-subunit alcohol dehydrogenase family)
MSGLEGRVCIVSGVGPGTGRAIALSLGRARARLVLACRTEEAARETAAEAERAGAEAIGVAMDVTKPEDRARVVGSALNAFGRIDVLVNNAFATGRPGLVESSDLVKGWRTAFEVNLFGGLALAQAVLPSMKKSGGSIVMVGSLAGRKPQPGLAAYGASKAALLAAARSLAAECGHSQIRVNTVVPGHIDGPNLAVHVEQEARRLGTSVEAVRRTIAAEGVLERIATPDEVAEAVTFFASPASSGITGQSLDVNCGQWFD